MQDTTETLMPGMMRLKRLRLWATDHKSNPFGIQWMKYDEGCPLPELVRTVTHVAFEVSDLEETLRGKRVIVAPNLPSPGVLVAVIEEAGAPVEFIQFVRPLPQPEAP